MTLRSASSAVLLAITWDMCIRSQYTVLFIVYCVMVNLLHFVGMLLSVGFFGMPFEEPDVIANEVNAFRIPNRFSVKSEIHRSCLQVSTRGSLNIHRHDYVLVCSLSLCMMHAFLYSLHGCLHIFNWRTEDLCFHIFLCLECYFPSLFFPVVPFHVINSPLSHSHCYFCIHKFRGLPFLLLPGWHSFFARGHTSTTVCILRNLKQNF